MKSCWIFSLILVGVLICAGIGYAQDDTDDNGPPEYLGSLLLGIFILIGLIIHGGIIYAALSPKRTD